MTESQTIEQSTSASSVGRMFLDRVAKTPNRKALSYPDANDQWHSFTWKETYDKVAEWAAGLIALGIEPEQRVGIASNTRGEWVLADLAIMCSGGATTTVYPSTPAEDVQFILSDSDTRILFAEDDTQLEKVLSQRDGIPSLTKVVLITGTPPADAGDFVITTDQLAELGKQHLAEHPNAIEERVAQTNPDMLATLIYTSGTTGRPKGVQLTHGNWVYEGQAIEAIDIINIDDDHFLWLPLAHSFGKVLMSAQLQIGFHTAVDGRVPKIVPNLAELKPTFMAAAPRIFEKIYAKVASGAEQAGGAKLKIFNWAAGVAQEAARRKAAGDSLGGVFGAQYALADRLVFSKLRNTMGGRIKYLVSGSAALNKDIGQFFYGAGLPILEGYGLTETSAFAFVVRPTNLRIGFVGEPAPGTEFKFDHDGEILIKGPGVMRGYHNLPEQTAEVFTEDGWFRTGDIGDVEHGLLKITDRKKDLIKTSGGKYVAPQGIESKFKAVCPYASNIVVHGDGRNFVSALVTLDPESIIEWGKQQGITGSYEQVVADPKTREMVQHHIDEMNKDLPRWETIKKFAILPRDLTVEEGELTPSLKVKRKEVEKRYMDVLDGFYQ
jgi:long-chain acyl-CoA synthetase